MRILKRRKYFQNGFSLIETSIALCIIMLIIVTSIGFISVQRVNKKILDEQFSLLLSDIRLLQEKAQTRGATQTLRLLWESDHEYMLLGETTDIVKIRHLPAGISIRGDKLRNSRLEFYPSGVVGPQAGGIIMSNGLSECSVYFKIGTGAAQIEYQK